MPYSEELKVFWFTPKRTASRSCATICDFFKFTEINNHRPPNKKQFPNYHFVCNVRNPYSRMLSLYDLVNFNKTKVPNQFKEWAMAKLREEVEIPNFTEDIQSNLSRIFEQQGMYPNQYVRFENLEEDLNKLEFFKNGKNEVLDMIIKSNIRRNVYRSKFFTSPWQNYYDEELANYVYSFLEKDFLLFGYDKNSWKDGTS